MKVTKLESYKRQLEATIKQIQEDVVGTREASLAPAGGQANGELSNAPMHLADSGTDAFHQELNSVLLENEQFLYDEAVSALQRLDDGTFGTCEACGKLVAEQRLDAIPSARYCIKCAEESDAGPELNLNRGRPFTETETIAGAEKMITRNERSSVRLSDRLENDQQVLDLSDRHAAGTPGGGTALGGLAGTNVGHGGPEAVQLEDAMGVGLTDDDADDESPSTPLSSRSGGAVRGAPAGKRSRKRPR